jgi:hypothetical protein
MLDSFSPSRVTITDDGEGGSFVDLGPDRTPPETSEHDQNLAEIIPDNILGEIAASLLDDIEADDRSRAEFLTMRDNGIGLLGLKINPPRSDISAGGAPFEGLSTFQDSALLEACVRFQANARGELLPATGPVKVQNAGEPVQQNDLMADALEKAINEFVTVGSPEYIPDHDRGFFQCGWSGLFLVKGFHCPLRLRPVVDSIDCKDIIISADVVDIQSAARVTQVIRMSKSTLIRMQIAGAYRDVDLAPATDEKTLVDMRIENISGVKKEQSSKPDKNDRTIYECYADYDIPGFEHEMDGRETGLPLPYRFVIDKASRKILEVRRNWKEGDEQCKKRRTFVAYPFVPAFGFFPLGLMNLMGNSTNAVTAAFRVAIDNGMINNFPYWLYAKGANQDKNDFRAGPGQGIPVNVPANARLADMFMPAPTKSLDPAFVQIMQMVKQDNQRIGGSADLQIGEGNQNAPVGTTIALIEQATKIMDAVHKRLHQAQAEEFRMLRELLQEDPEALWRWNGKRPYNADVLIEALNDYELIPQADPNVSSHMMRMTKAEAVKQTVMAAPQLHDVKAAAEWYYRQIGVPEACNFLLQVPAQPQPPQGLPAPNADNGARAMATVATAKMKEQGAQQDRALKVHEISQKAAIDAQTLDLKRQELAQRAQDAAADRAQRALEHRMDLAKELIIHPASPNELQATEQQAGPTQ